MHSSYLLPLLCLNVVSLQRRDMSGVGGQADS
jgi:hypothetical protein